MPRDRTERRITELEARLAAAEARIRALEDRPAPHNPFRPIGPRPGHAPWEDRLKEPGDEVVWPPITRHL